MKNKLIAPELLRLFSKYREKYTVERNQLCICGSGEKYKKCCLKCLEVPGDKLNYLKIAGEYFDKENFADSEKYFRAHLTQYLIWYNEHTVPLLRHAPDAAGKLFQIDIEAIAALSASIVRTLYKQNKHESIDNFLKYIATLINNDRFKFYIDTQRALWLNQDGEKEKATQLLSKYTYDVLENIPTTSGGVSALGVYLEIKSPDIPARVSIKIVEKLLGAVDSKELKVDLLSRKARISFLSNDEELAKTTAETLEQEVLALEQTDINVLKEIKNVLPNAYRTLAIILDKDRYKQKLLECIQEEIASDNKNVLFVADLYYSMGQVYDMLGDYGKAIDSYSKAINLNDKPEYHLDVVKAYVGRRDYKKAEEVLSTIDYGKVKGSLEIDYLSYLADIALAKNDPQLAIKTEKRLAALQEQIPYFRLLISNYRGVLLDFVSKKYSVNSLSYKIRSFLSRNLILQPNAFGIGINFNEILRPKEDDPHV